MLSLSHRVPVSLTIRPQRVTRTVATVHPQLPATACEIIGDYVGEDFGRGLTPLVIGKNCPIIERDIDSPLQHQLGQGGCQPSSQAAGGNADISTGTLLGQQTLSGSAELLAARRPARATMTRAPMVSSLAKWQYLFYQIYSPEASQAEDMENLTIFKAELIDLDIDDLLKNVPVIVPILGDPERLCDLLRFHLLFHKRHFAKALFLTIRNLVPSDLNDYNYLRAIGCSRERAALAIASRKEIVNMGAHLMEKYPPMVHQVSLLKKL